MEQPTDQTGAFATDEELEAEEEREEREERHHRKHREKKGADRGFYVQLGAGAEGYTGSLAPALDIGPAYGATLGVRPFRQMGLELAYSGALTGVDLSRAGGPGQNPNRPPIGTSIQRNGGQGAIIVAMSPTRFQPYLMGGVGIEDYDVSTSAEALGFRDDLHGYVPAGAGLRYQFGKTIHADLRGNYSFLFGDDFSPVPDTDAFDGRLQAMLMAGGTF